MLYKSYSHHARAWQPDSIFDCWKTNWCLCFLVGGKQINAKGTSEHQKYNSNKSVMVLLRTSIGYNGSRPKYKSTSPKQQILALNAETASQNSERNEVASNFDATIYSVEPTILYSSKSWLERISLNVLIHSSSVRFTWKETRKKSTTKKLACWTRGNKTIERSILIEIKWSNENRDVTFYFLEIRLKRKCPHVDIVFFISILFFRNQQELFFSASTRENSKPFFIENIFQKPFALWFFGQNILKNRFLTSLIVR